MFAAMPMETLPDGRFSVLVSDNEDRLTLHKLENVTPKSIAESIATRYDVPVNRVAFKEEHTVQRGNFRGMTTFVFFVIADVKAPF